jgi:hypothetical protein
MPQHALRGTHRPTESTRRRRGREAADSSRSCGAKGLSRQGAPEGLAGLHDADQNPRARTRRQPLHDRGQVGLRDGDAAGGRCAVGDVQEER